MEGSEGERNEEKIGRLRAIHAIANDAPIGKNIIVCSVRPENGMDGWG